MKVWHSFYINIIMTAKFKIGEHVTWNSEAGHVSGKIIKIHTKDFNYKGYTVQRSCSPKLIAYSLQPIALRPLPYKLVKGIPILIADCNIFFADLYRVFSHRGDLIQCHDK